MRRPLTSLATATLALLLAGAGTASAHATEAAGFSEPCTGQVAQAHTSEGNTAPTATNDSASILAGDWMELDVLGNDTDAEGDLLSVVSVSQPRHGFTCVNSDGTIEYDSAPGTATGNDQFTYGITDGDFFRTATATISVEGLTNVVPKLTRTLRTDRHGHLVRRAKFTVTNTNGHDVEFLAGKFRSDNLRSDRIVAAGTTSTSFHTRYHYLDFVAVVPKENGDAVLIDIGTLNTKTGKVSLWDISETGIKASARTLQRHGVTKLPFRLH